MTSIGQRVKVRGEEYVVRAMRSTSGSGSKFFGRFVFTLRKVSDGSTWEVYGKSVAHNSRISPSA